MKSTGMSKRSNTMKYAMRIIILKVHTRFISYNHIEINNYIDRKLV